MSYSDTTGRRLRMTRIIVSATAMIILSASIAGIGWVCPGVGRWLTRIQIIPSIMFYSVVSCVVWLVVTLLFGRIYCSSICPLGTYMDIFARIPRLRRKDAARRRYAWRRPCYRLQYVMLLIALAGLMGGFGIVAEVFDPFTVYADFLTLVTDPLVGDGGGYSPLRTAGLSLAGSGVAAALMVIVAAVAARSGRTICNSICPVGTTLGFISRYAVFQIDINTDKCIRCGRCADACKAGCIDLADSTVDGIRCVDCFDCLTVCPNDAITYTPRRHRLSDVMMQRIDRSKASAAASGPRPSATASAPASSVNHPVNNETVSRPTSAYNGQRQ